MDSHSWDERYAGSDLVWSATPNQFVADGLASLEPGRAVDLAAGEGRNALWLASLGWQVTAVDFSQKGLDKGRAVEQTLTTKHPIDWVCADVLTWPGLDNPDEPWDLTLIAYLQVPEDERRKVVRRAFTSLPRRGTFFLVAHDSTNLFEGTGGPQDPEVLMTAEDVLRDLGDQDFEVIQAERRHRVVTEDDGHGGEVNRTAYDCVVHLERL